MNLPPITVSVALNGTLDHVWHCYTQPEHIVHWNFADPSWHCPTASNDLQVGGTYLARMEAKDGSFGFDFEAVYTAVNPRNQFTYEFGGRRATVEFEQEEGRVVVRVTFDPETENPIEMQRAGWQAILENFKRYAEGL